MSTDHVYVFKVTQLFCHLFQNFVCSGALVQYNFVLTAASCIQGPLQKYRLRLGDWDLKSDYNEYETYRNLETRVCASYPISYKDKGYSYGYGGSGDLILLQIDDELNFDKYPQVKPVCLPTYYDYAYKPQSYEQKPAYEAAKPMYGYSKPSSYGYESKPAYNKPSYGYDTYQSECWVAGWYGSPTTPLRNVRFFNFKLVYILLCV